MKRFELSDDQRDAVERTGQDVCVVAGPGSGKTRVLTERFAWLVEKRAIDPERVLAMTFTEKAATEIKQRLMDRFSTRPDLREGIERAWVSTIHGFCARLLREHAITAGLAPDFSVLEQAPADRMAREAAEQAIDWFLRENPEETRRLLESLDLSTQDDGPQPDLARSLLEVYEAKRLSGIVEFAPHAASSEAFKEAANLAQQILRDATVGNTANQRTGHAEIREWAQALLESRAELRLPVALNALVNHSPARIAAKLLKDEVLERVAAERIGRRNAGLMELIQAILQKLDSLYREKKRTEAALDFADLEEFTIALLESQESIRRDVVRRFDEILVDELQDTNRLQWRLIHLIRGSLFAVGDVNQSIYGFRYAEPAVFHEYRRALIAANAQIDALNDNHRSFKPILDAVSAILKGAAGIEPRDLVSQRGGGPAVERISALGDDSEEVEAAMVAARIREMVDSRSREFKDIAVLVRALSAVEPFVRAFDRFQIPFLVSGGRTFWEAREIRDLMVLMAALVNPLDEIALAGVLRGPLCGIGDEELFRMGREEWRFAFDARFGALRKMADFRSPDVLLARAIDECGYAANLSERARTNIEKLFQWLRREFTARPRPLAEMLEDVEALRGQQSEAEAPPPDAANVVRVMSIHAAKGLQFPVVFVSALHRRPDARKPVVVLTADGRLGAKWRNAETGEGQSDEVHLRFVKDAKAKDEAEENRLLYVAMTRAEDVLILSHGEKQQRSPWVKLAEAIPVTRSASIAPEPKPVEIEVSSEAREILCDPPEIYGQYDSAAPVTAIARFHECPRKWFLSTLDEGDVINGGGGMATGLAVHQILAGEAVEGGEAEELARRFKQSELGRRAERAERVEREFDFMLAIEDVVLQGRMDLWFEEAGELVLVDYKSDRDESSSAEYGLQLRLYALALERYAGRVPDRAVLYFLRSDRVVEISLGKEEFEEALRAVVDFREGQERMTYPLRIGERCRRCEFLSNLCPAAV